MYRSILLTAFCAFFLFHARAQKLYMPRDIQHAFNNDTRSGDGKPGKNYWQNHGRYNISITALPPNRTINGTEQVTYFNNSPDTFKKLNMKLILNIHRPVAARFSNTTMDYITQGIRFDSFMVDGEQKTMDNELVTGTNEMVSLSQPLFPHDSVKLDIAWHYEISKKSEREGMIDSTSYFLAYFYPRVAVYDDYNGWDTLPFIEEQEFYNDFNDYTLNITVPKNYVVWATGTLQNADRVLQPEYVKRLQRSYTSDSTVHIVAPVDLAQKSITAQNNTNTWIWKANNVTDMAAGISDHYDWDAASVVVDNGTDRRASMQAAFLDNAKDFHNSVQAGRNSLSWLSENLPGVPYPFPKMTAFQGFADMEYPMMVNDNHDDDVRSAQFTQDHEIAHTYFPFYMGINESRYAFMDEGWATTFELWMGIAEVGKEKGEDIYKKFRVRRWIHDRATAQDLPIIIPSSELRSGYGNNAYGKPSLAYLALRDLLGDDLFKKALHVYMSNWNGKHPIPWDFFNSMNSGSGKRLNWFFNNWFFTNYYIDLDLQKVTKNLGGYTVSIQNIGGFAVPFDIRVTYTDGTGAIFHQTPLVWQRDQGEVNIKIKAKKTIRSAVLDGGIFMDADERNNKWTAK